MCLEGVGARGVTRGGQSLIYSRYCLEGVHEIWPNAQAGSKIPSEIRYFFDFESIFNKTAEVVKAPHVQIPEIV